VPSFFVEKVNSLNVGNIESFDLIIPRDWVSPQRPIFVFVGEGVDYNTLCACEKPLLDSGRSGFGCEYRDAEGNEYYQSCSPLTTDAKIVFGSGSEDCNIKYRVLDANYRWVEGVMNFNCLKIDSSRKTLEMVNDGVNITISSILDV
jgi:hypothetical protein